MPASNQFYPSLAYLLPLEAIPQNLGAVRGALQDAFSHIYYRDLQVEKSGAGDAAFYRLELVLYRRLALEVPGTGGLALVLNPEPAVTGVTAIPISLGYRLDILKYVRGFEAASVADLPGLLYRAMLDLTGLNERGLLEEVIGVFFDSEATDGVAAFVEFYNAAYQPQVLLQRLNDPDDGLVLDDLRSQLVNDQQLDIADFVLDGIVKSGASADVIFARLGELFGRVARQVSVDDLKRLCIPHVEAAVNDIRIALEFPRSVLIPVDEDANSPGFGEALPEPHLSRLSCTVGSVSYSTDAGMQFSDDFAGIDFTKSLIGKTGITLAFNGVKLDLSRTTNIPEATADGRPVDFVGVYVQQATVGLPKKWFKQSSNAAASTAQITGTGIIIGTGGFSGTVGFDVGGVLHTKLGNFEAGLDAFDLRFERNSIVESNISGWLTIPGFKNAAGGDADISIKAHVAEDGDFSVTATEPNGIPLSIPGVLDFKIFTLGFGREDERFFLNTSGNVTLTFNIPALSFDRPIAFDLKKLVIWEDGQFEIEGGTIILPQALTLKIGPVKLSVTAISMGSYERNGHKYKYFGFDGGVNVNPGGVDVRASGVKVYWRTDAPAVNDLDIFVRVEGIGVDIVIPGGKSAADATVLISGFLQVKEPDPTVPGSSAGTEYAGGISFKMPKAGFGGSAAMRLNPSIPAFIIDTELSIPVPIPLGNTSLGICAFRGMIGLRYVADRAYPPLGLAPDAEWYEYYKKKVPLSYREGINIDKFAPRPGFAVGAGLTLCTITDSGKVLSAKLFLLLSLPDALLLQGQAAVLGERVDLTDKDPPFFILIAVTKQSVEAAFGVFYRLPEDTGAILDLQAIIEMGFYFNDASAWHVNAGRETPESKRVTARLFTLFNAWSYLMLSGSGIRAGAGVTWDFEKGFGPVQIGAHAYLDTRGRVSFKPKQIGASILLGGSAAVRVFKFKLGFSVSAALAAEAPEPFIVTGSVDVEVDLPKPFKKYGGTFTMEFTWTFNSSLNTQPVPVFNEEDVGEGAKSVNLVTRERFDLNVLAPGSPYASASLPPPPGSGWADTFDKFVLPLDCALDIEFKKPIAPAPGVTNIGIPGSGYANTELVPPQRGKSPQVQHEYVVEEVKIRCWNPRDGRWDDYDVYAALTPLAHAPFVNPAALAGLKDGWWQLNQPGRVNKLSLLSQTPLDYANDAAGPFVPENSGVTDETIFCPTAPIAEQCCVLDEFPNLKTLAAGCRYALKDVQARVVGEDGRVVPCLNPFGLTNGVALRPGSRLELFFPEATGSVSLRLATLADDLTVLYQRRRQTGVNSSRQPVYDYVTVKREVPDAVGLLRELKYDDAGSPVNKVVVIAGECECREGITAAGSASTSADARWPPERPPAPPPPPAPPCGSLAAYLSNACADARRQLESLRLRRERLLAQAHEYELLAERYRDERFDPTLFTRYHESAQAALDGAAALAREIEHLEAFADCCRRLRAAGTGGAPPPGAPPRADRFECNIDPGLDYKCLTVVFGFCWLPLRDQLFNNTIPSFSTLSANNSAMVRAVNNTIRPLWRPDTVYAVSIRTADRVTVPETGASAGATRYMHVGFRTRGPLGHAHQHRAEYAALKAQDRADQYRLQSLKPYINFATSYPNADGNVLDAKPLFYVNPKLQLFYKHAHVYTMFGGQFDAYNGNPAVTSTIEVSILDPVNPLPEAPDDHGYVPPVSCDFAANGLGHLDPDVRLVGNMAAQGQPCTIGQQPLAPAGIQSNVTVERLKPQKLYLAVFKANYNGVREQIHLYNFQTSRYADFEEQVNSYRLKDEDGAYLRDAVYDDIAVTLDATRAGQLAALLSNTYPAGDPLEQEYADPFDRLLHGILRVGPLDPPSGTDFNVVRDGAGGAALGILVRNPEPFNDPKMPSAVVGPTIKLSQGGATASTFTTVHSKDRSMAFVGGSGLSLTLQDLDFTFTYLEYDGASYVPASVVTVSLFVSQPPGPGGAGVSTE